MVLAGDDSFNYTIKKSQNQHWYCWRELLFFVFLIFSAKFYIHP